MSLEIIKDYISYNKETGEFYRIKPYFGVKLNSRAGYVNNKGYVHIKFMNKYYLAHRLAWFYEFGYIPLKSLDHINGIKTDNRIINLREVTHSENMRNKKIHREGKECGFYYHRRIKRYHVKTTINKLSISLGYYLTKEQALLIYKKFFSNLNETDCIKEYIIKFKKENKLCKKGHLFSIENQIVNKKGVRRCKTCYLSYLNKN